MHGNFHSSGRCPFPGQGMSVEAPSDPNHSMSPCSVPVFARCYRASEQQPPKNTGERHQSTRDFPLIFLCRKELSWLTTKLGTNSTTAVSPFSTLIKCPQPLSLPLYPAQSSNSHKTKPSFPPSSFSAQPCC